MLYMNGECTLIPGIQNEAVHTTGAGDSFNGTFAYSARTGMPTKEEVEEFLSTYDLRDTKGRLLNETSHIGRRYRY